MDHPDGTLVHIVFLDEIVARFRFRNRNLRFPRRRPLRPGGESLPQLGFHRGRVKVSDEAEENVVWMNVTLMPVEQVVPRDRGDGRVLGNASIGGTRSVGQLHRLPVGDFKRIVISPRNARIQLVLGQRYFIFAERGFAEQLDEDFEDVVKIVLQAVPGDCRRIERAGGLDFCRARFQVIVEFISRLRLCAACSPHLPVNLHQADFAGGLVGRPAPNHGGPPNQRQLVVLLKKNHHAIGQRDPQRLLRMELMQGRDSDLPPIGHLAAGYGGEEEKAQD